MKLFVYGSLKDKPVLERVIGRSWKGEYKEAVLYDHVKMQPSWYYMIFEKEGEEVKGWLVNELSHEDFQELDRYEGVGDGLFRRKTVYVPKYDTVAEVYYNGEKYKLEDYALVTSKATEE